MIVYTQGILNSNSIYLAYIEIDDIDLHYANNIPIYDENFATYTIKKVKL